MIKIVEIFDDILFYVATYPITLAYLVFSPKKVVGDAQSTLSCPPNIAFTISFLFVYIAIRLVNSIQQPKLAVFKEPAIMIVVLVIGILAVILMVQRLFLAGIFRMSREGEHPVKEMKDLSYAFSLSFTFYALALIFSVILPDLAFTIGPLWDTDTIHLTRDNFVDSANGVGMMAASVGYFIGVFNIVRSKYEKDALRAIGITLTFYTLSILVFVIIVFTLAHTIEMANVLSQRYSTR